MSNVEVSSLMNDSTDIVDHSCVEDGTTTPEALSASQQRNKIWGTLSVSVLLGLVSGTLYGFGRYSRDLRDTLNLSQLQVQRFGIMIDTGNYIGHPLTGLIYDRLGPRASCLSAAVVVFLSYGSIHLGLFDAPLWFIDLGFFGVGFGSGMGYIAGLGSTTAEFLSTPHRSRAVAFVAAGYGLSSTLVGITYHQFGLHHFFLFWAFLVAIVNIIGAAVFSGKAEDEILVGDRADGNPENSVSDTTSTLGLPTSSPALESNEDEATTETDGLQERLLPENSSIIENEPNSWTSWKRVDFWLLFASFACVTGCGLFVINNISTMVQSMGEPDRLAGSLVFLLSICNVIGRVKMGLLADHPRFHKLDLFRYSSFLMALALMTSAVGGNSPVCLAITVGLVAIAYGGSWVIIVGILADLYGKADFGKDYGLMAMGPAISGMIFNFTSAWLYQEHADPVSGVCIGEACYRNSYVMTASAALLGCLILSRMPSQPT